MKADHPYHASASELNKAIAALTRARDVLEGGFGDSANTFMAVGSRHLVTSMELLFHAERQHLRRDRHDDQERRY